MVTMCVRPAEIRDVPAMMEMERGTEAAAHWTEQDYLSIFTEIAPRRVALVAEREPVVAMQVSSICGFIVARCFYAEWEIENVVVAPAERRRGFGSKLVGDLIKLAAAEGARSVELEVRCTNFGAINLYGKYGFHQRGTRKAYYSNPLEDALLLRLEFPAAASENG